MEHRQLKAFDAHFDMCVMQSRKEKHVLIVCRYQYIVMSSDEIMAKLV